MSAGSDPTTDGLSLVVGEGLGHRWWLGADPDDRRNAGLDLVEVVFAAGGVRRWSGWSDISVAAHSVNVARYVRLLGGTEAEIRTAAGHDLHEVLICDVPRPVKQWLRNQGSTGFDRLEDLTAAAFAHQFDWLWPHPEIVHLADSVICGVEATALGRDITGWGLPPVLPDFSWWRAPLGGASAAAALLELIPRSW